MYDLGILIEKDFRITLNYLKAMKHNPKRLLLFIIYIAYFGWLTYVNLNQLGTLPPTANLVTMSLGIMAFTILIFAGSISASIKEQFSLFRAPDVPIIFTSPLKPVSVFAAALIKASWSTVLLLLFMALMLSRWVISGTTNWWLLCLLIIFITLLNASVQPLNFVLSRIQWPKSSSMKISIFTSLWAIPTAIMLLNSGFNIDYIAFSNFSNAIPLVGWIKAITLYCYGAEVAYIGLYFSLLTGYFILTYGGALLLAANGDYYEDMMGGAEYFTNLRRQMREGRYQRKASKRVKRVANEQSYNSHHALSTKWMGPMAFTWKEYAVAKKLSFHPLVSTREILYILCALGITISSYFVESDFALAIPYIFNGVLLYITFLFTMANKSQPAFMTARFVMTPGSGTTKLFALYWLDIIRFSLMILVSNLIMCFSSEAQIGLLGLCIVGQVIIYLEVLFINMFMLVFFQNATDYNLMMPLIRILQILVFIIPNAIVAAAVATFTQSFSITLIAVFLLNAGLVTAFLFTAGLMVNAIEISR